MESFRIYSAGIFVESKLPHTVYSPFSGKPVATTFLADEQIMENSIQQALLVQKELRELPSYKRYEILMFIAAELKRSREELAKLLSLESAKPLKYALGEIDRAAQTFLVAAEESKRLPKEYLSLDWTPAGSGKEGIVHYFPVGLVAGIAPFNFPMNLAVHKIAPAIAAGCPIILKPASTTPLSTLALARIIDRSGLPKGAVSILPMDRKTGNQLVSDERFKLLSFTGSPVVGWEMKKNAGKKKVVLELGGNAAVIITKHTNLPEIISKCVVAGFSYSGQICIHAQRFYVHQDRLEEFKQLFLEAIQQLTIGDPLDPQTDFSVMIDEENALRLESWIKEAISQGAKLLLGGSRNGKLLEPTVLTNTHRGMKINGEEAFGPVVIIESFQTIDEAIHQVNDSKFGLQAAIFSNDQQEIDLAFRELEVGGVIVNDVPTFRVDHMPYGGVKNSGLGREGVKYAIHDMLEPRILVK